MNLIVEDDYITGVGSFLKKNYEKYDDYVNQYIEILGKIAEKGIVSGQTHDALVEFQNQVATQSGAKNSSAKSFGKKYNTFCTKFISDLDSADGDLY